MNQLSDNVKSQFFIQYWGQRVAQHTKSTTNLELQEVSCAVLAFSEICNTHLLLRTVEQLTDGELWIAAEIMGWNELGIEPKYILNRVKLFISTALHDNHWDIRVFQYLLRIGVLLPFLYLEHDGKPQTLTPEQIVEMGWVRIKE